MKKILITFGIIIIVLCVFVGVLFNGYMQQYYANNANNENAQEQVIEEDNNNNTNIANINVNNVNVQVNTSVNTTTTSSSSTTTNTSNANVTNGTSDEGEVDTSLLRDPDDPFYGLFPLYPSIDLEHDEFATPVPVPEEYANTAQRGKYISDGH